ncbi:nucleotidyltransferase domain-containing protein [Thermodesulfobium sp. 4217-1]|uniref:nucleotidyltransferase domain-containing protein n=1 Tax=Thermodesulfobium sp. 4217-1 TaxID=3120013 RepID=UPI0032215300
MPDVKALRLTKEEIDIIEKTIKYYDPTAEVVIFGSRTDMEKKGGDIDILVVSEKIDFDVRRKIRVDLILAFGDRKIDLVVTDKPEKSDFTKICYKYGVKL